MNGSEGITSVTSAYESFAEGSSVMSPTTFLVESGKEVSFDYWASCEVRFEEKLMASPCCMKVYYENGVHYLEDGHYWVEVPGICESDEDEDYFDTNIIKKTPMKVRFSTNPMKVVIAIELFFTTNFICWRKTKQFFMDSFIGLHNVLSYGL